MSEHRSSADYIDRTIETVRVHRSSENSWPQWEFLETPGWRKLRRKVLKRDQHTCRKCGSTNNLRVHHKRYRQRLRPPLRRVLEWLITLCDPCHQKEHRRLLRRKKAKWRKINQKRRVR